MRKYTAKYLPVGTFEQTDHLTEELKGKRTFYASFERFDIVIVENVCFHANN